MTLCNNKELLKHLDKFYSALCKAYDENVSTGIVNDVLNIKLVPYICINLRMGSSETVEKIYKCIKNIKLFKDAIIAHIEVIVMSSVMFPESMKVALDIYDDCNISKFSKKFNDEMLICIYKHAMNYPQNKDACINCIRRHASPDLILNRPFMFLTDETDIIQEHFSRDKKEKDNLYNLCIDSDSINTLLKAVRYHKESNVIICKLGLPTFLENLRYIDIKNPITRIKLYEEITTFSRWEFLPFIFEEHRPEGKEWDVFRFGLYQGYINPVFLKTLIHYMEKYEIPIETLKSTKDIKLLCSEEVAEIFKEYNLDETFKIIPASYMTEYLSPGMSNLFYAFINKKYKYIIDYMHLSVSNYNSRFIKERAYLNRLVNENKLGWNTEMKVKWTAFVQFTYEIIEELNTLDMCLSKYNSFFSVVNIIEPMISIRLINDIYNHFKEIKSIHIIEKCGNFTESIKYYKKQLLREVRDYINIDLPVDEEWELPENPTLEDYFRYVYQYSNFGNDFFEDGFSLINNLRNAGCVKIAQECYIALTKFVPLQDIKNILKIKDVLPI